MHFYSTPTFNITNSLIKEKIIRIFHSVSKEPKRLSLIKIFLFLDTIFPINWIL